LDFGLTGGGKNNYKSVTKNITSKQSSNTIINMANNYDIRSGLLMKIELNKNYVENMLVESYKYEFDDKAYNNATDEKINAFWTLLNEKCVHIFERTFEYNTNEKVLEAIKDELDYLSNQYEWDFSFNDKRVHRIYKWDEEGQHSIKHIDTIDNEVVEEGIEDGRYFFDNDYDLINNDPPSNQNPINHYKYINPDEYGTIGLDAYTIRTSWMAQYFDTKTLFDLDNDETYVMRLYGLKKNSGFEKEKRGCWCDLFWTIDDLVVDGWIFYTNYNTSSSVAMWFCGVDVEENEDYVEEDVEEQVVEDSIDALMDAVFRPKIKQPKVKLIIVE